MRRLILFFFIAVFSLSGFSQEKLFKAALKNGRPFKDYYVIYNDKSKMVKPQKLIKDATKHDYLLGDYTIKEIGRFGDVAESVETFRFLPKDEYDDYIFENISGNMSYSKLVNSGSVYFYGPQNTTYFNLCTDVLWSGEVKNGLVCGTGQGFKQIGPKSFMFFSGTFIDGIPSGESRFCTYNDEGTDNYRYANNKCHQATVKTGRLSEGMCWIAERNGYGYINAQGELVIPARYNNANDFSHGIAYVKEGSVEVKINKKGDLVGISENAQLSYDDMVSFNRRHPETVESIEVLVSKYIQGETNFEHLVRVESDFPGMKSEVLKYKTALYRRDCQKLDECYDRVVAALGSGNRDVSGRTMVSDFIGLYKKHSFDPDGKLAEARDLDDFYAVCQALGVGIKSSYWSSGFSRPTFDDSGFEDVSILKRAKEVCDNCDNPNFAGFYQSVKDNLSYAYESLDRKVSNDYSRYQQAYAEYQAKQRKIEEHKKKVLETVNTSNIYNYVKYEGSWSRGRVFDTDDDYTDHRSVDFVDLNTENSTFTVTIHEDHHESRGEHYYSSSNCNRTYSTYIDCLVAAFLAKYDKRW